MAALWIPALLAVVVVTYSGMQTAQNAARDQDISSMVGLAPPMQKYVIAVDNEARAAFQIPSPEGTVVPKEQGRKETDAALAALIQDVRTNTKVPADLEPMVQELTELNLNGLKEIRGLVDQGPIELTSGMGTTTVNPVGVFDLYYQLEASIGGVPTAFVGQVSSAKMRETLAAQGALSILASRLSAEQAMVQLFAKGSAKLEDVAAAVRATNSAQSQADTAVSELDVKLPAMPAWSELGTQIRQVEAVQTQDPTTVKIPQKLYETQMGEANRIHGEDALKRAAAAREQMNAVMARSMNLADEARITSRNQIIGTFALVAMIVALAAFVVYYISRRALNPLLGVIGQTEKRVDVLPVQLEAIGRGEPAPQSEPLKTPRALPEVRLFAARLNELVDTTVDLATREAQQRASVVGMLRTVAHRQAALVNRQLELLDKYERHEVDPVFLSRLFNLDHVTTQMRRMCDSLLVLGGGSPVRRTTPPLSLVDVVRGASSQIQQYSRIDLDVWYDPRVHGHKVSDLTLLIAELLDNATKYSHPDTRVTATLTRGPEGAVITIADEGIGFDDTTIAEVQRQVDTAGSDQFELFDRLGLQTVAKLCGRTGVTVHFSGGTNVAGTRVAVVVPDSALVDADRAPAMQLASVGEDFDDSVNRPGSVTLYGQIQG